MKILWNRETKHIITEKQLFRKTKRINYKRFQKQKKSCISCNNISKIYKTFIHISWTTLSYLRISWIWSYRQPTYFCSTHFSKCCSFFSKSPGSLLHYFVFSVMWVNRSDFGIFVYLDFCGSHIWHYLQFIITKKSI